MLGERIRDTHHFIRILNPAYTFCINYSLNWYYFPAFSDKVISSHALPRFQLYYMGTVSNELFGGQFEPLGPVRILTQPIITLTMLE